MLPLLERPLLLLVGQLDGGKTFLHVEPVEVQVDDGHAVRVRRELLRLDKGCMLELLQVQPVEAD